MRSVQLQKVYDVAAQIEKKEWEQYRKLGKNPHRSKYNRMVYVSLDDGSSMSLRNSYVETYKNEDGEWYIIFSEHYDTHVFHHDDVLVITQYPEDIKIQALKVPK